MSSSRWFQPVTLLAFRFHFFLFFYLVTVAHESQRRQMTSSAQRLPLQIGQRRCRLATSDVIRLQSQHFTDWLLCILSDLSSLVQSVECSDWLLTDKTNWSCRAHRIIFQGLFNGILKTGPFIMRIFLD